MFLCAPPFIKVAGGSAGYYEIEITIGSSSGYYGYSDFLGFGSINAYDDIFQDITIRNSSNTARVMFQPGSPVNPASGTVVSCTITSGASSTGALTPNGTVNFSSGYYYQNYTTSIDMNAGGTATVIIEFTPA